MEKLAKAHVVVRGRVQGVFYRQSTKDKAQALGLSGWVRNQPDGSVALEASGPKHDVERLIAWCWHGPSSAHVSEVEVDWLDEPGAPEHSSRFDILR